MLLYGYIAQWKKNLVDGVAVLSIVGAVAAFAINRVVGPSPACVCAFFIFGMIALLAGALMLSPDSMEKARPVPESFYKPLGAFNATIRNVVEVETDSGAVLFADADSVPEVACFRGARVEVDVAAVVSPAGQGDVRADGVGGFVDARECKSTADYGADVAMGDEPRGKWGGKARFYAVTAVRAID